VEKSGGKKEKEKILKDDSDEKMGRETTLGKTGGGGGTGWLLTELWTPSPGEVPKPNKQVKSAKDGRRPQVLVTYKRILQKLQQEKN